MDKILARELKEINNDLYISDVKDSYGTFEEIYKKIDEIYSNLLENHRNKTENCITGNNDYLINSLKNSIKISKRIDIIVSFLMESGVRLLYQDLCNAAKGGAVIRILTGSYLNITQPSALYLLKDCLKDKLDLRMYSIENKSFHPKAYLFEYENGGDIFIGSSNISKSALTGGIEWNYKIEKAKSEKDYIIFKNEFNNLFNNYSIIMTDAELKKYSMNWKRPKVYDYFADEKLKDNVVKDFIKPRGAQIEALYELKKAREEFVKKAIVVVATGVGKTYLAAFDSLKFKRILYVAHREEILEQAKKSFKNVSKNRTYGFFNSLEKDKDVDVLFASVQSLGKEEYLNEEFFKRDEFDYIIIDEFHHAVAGNYMNIINYFTPQFLLGLTATPERLDNKDVFAICDYNIVYEARLKDAINKGWLVPFRYYGIYDDVDYDNIEYKNGKYNEKQLEEALMINKRALLLLNHYKKYNSKRALGFCASKKHAEYMAKYFSENGIKSCSVFSGNKDKYTLDRTEAISKLNSGIINVIFSVDMFNEGLDVPSVDMVMFLRPTESPTIFLQQLGRGLRKAIGKKYLYVLDFIGNYKKVKLIPFFLTGDIGKYNYNNRNILPEDEDYPDDCIVDFDFKVIDIFKRQENKKAKIMDLLIEDYFRVKEIVNKRPMRLEMFTYMDDDIFEIIKRKSDFNIFNEYLQFLNSISELSDEENKFINTKGYKFINYLEKTHMTRSYKMPLLLTFFNDGNILYKIDKDKIYESFYRFYNSGTNGLDLLQDVSGQNYRNWSKSDYLKIAKNPIDAFLNTASEFFYHDGDYFCINDNLKVFKNDKWFIDNFKDVINYKIRNYYKARLIEKYNKEKIEIKYALRDEKTNIYSLTYGNLSGKYPFQIFICKKDLIPENRKIFLLDPKKSNPVYSLSDAGKEYLNRINDIDFNYSFAAIIDCQIKISISKEIFDGLYTNDFFALWNPDAPYKYFQGNSEGYLVLFRVYKISNVVNEDILEKGRTGRNFYYRTEKIINTDLLNPVVNDNLFNRIKEDLIKFLSTKNYIINIS